MYDGEHGDNFMRTDARNAAIAVRKAFPARHPALLSAIVWLYTGAGSGRIWVDGGLVVGDGRDPDSAWLPPDDPVGRQSRPVPAMGVVSPVDGMLPRAGFVVAALHSRDFSPPGDMPALRTPYEAEPSHLAGALLACRVLLACGSLVTDPAGAPPGMTRARLARGLYVASAITARRDITIEVWAAVRELLEDATERPPSRLAMAFADPGFADD